MSLLPTSTLYSTYILRTTFSPPPPSTRNPQPSTLFPLLHTSWYQIILSFPSSPVACALHSFGFGNPPLTAFLDQSTCDINLPTNCPACTASHPLIPNSQFRNLRLLRSSQSPSTVTGTGTVTRCGALNWLLCGAVVSPRKRSRVLLTPPHLDKLRPILDPSLIAKLPCWPGQTSSFWPRPFIIHSPISADVNTDSNLPGRL